MNPTPTPTIDTPHHDPAEEAGAKLLHAVERITDGPEAIRDYVADLRLRYGEDSEQLAEAAIRAYSNQSALIGGATALPALLPGIGTVLSLTAGPLADMVLLLKLEVELGLALATIHGFDVRIPEERQLVFLAAALHTAEVSRDRSCLSNTLEVSASAIWNYTPRRAGKLLATVATALAANALVRGAARALPLIGIAVGASLNKVLTANVGRSLHQDLRTRRRLLGE